MRTAYWLLILALAVVITAFVTVRRTGAATPASTAAVSTPVGTVKELMEGIVDPASDVVFQSVSIEVSKAGTIEKAPKNDEEWGTVEHNALMLAEAANLLKMSGRHVARPEQMNTKSEKDAPELTPAQIEVKIDKDRTLWAKYADGLQTAAITAMKMAKAHDKDGLFEIGEAIDNACEQCHVEYWYPDQNKGSGAPPKG